MCHFFSQIQIVDLGQQSMEVLGPSGLPPEGSVLGLRCACPVSPLSRGCLPLANEYVSGGEMNLLFFIRHSPTSFSIVDDSCLKWFLLCHSPSDSLSSHHPVPLSHLASYYGVLSSPLCVSPASCSRSTDSLCCWL